ncbi:MAG TPA: helix-turn-helix transcriptional regulator [Polyangiaceae bacterium]|jgi:transcriptional regulator with XRE-family HTH domain
MGSADQKKKKPRGAAPPLEMKQLPRRLKAEYDLRKKRDGLTQQDLAAATGLSQAVISDLMSEPLTEGMTVASLALLARELNVSLDYLVMGVGDEAPKLHRSQPPRDLPPAVRSLRESESPPPMFPSTDHRPETIAPESESTRNKER